MTSNGRGDSESKLVATLPKMASLASSPPFAGNDDQIVSFPGNKTTNAVGNKLPVHGMQCRVFSVNPGQDCGCPQVFTHLFFALLQHLLCFVRRCQMARFSRRELKNVQQIKFCIQVTGKPRSIA